MLLCILIDCQDFQDVSIERLNAMIDSHTVGKMCFQTRKLFTKFEFLGILQNSEKKTVENESLVQIQFRCQKLREESSNEYVEFV